MKRIALAALAVIAVAVPERANAQNVYALNPMVGVIDGFRWAILRGTSFHWMEFLISLVVVTVLLASGIHYFRKSERSFADVI